MKHNKDSAKAKQSVLKEIQDLAGSVMAKSMKHGLMHKSVTIEMGKKDEDDEENEGGHMKKGHSKEDYAKMLGM